MPSRSPDHSPNNNGEEEQSNNQVPRFERGRLHYAFENDRSVSLHRRYLLYARPQTLRRRLLVGIAPSQLGAMAPVEESEYLQEYWLAFLANAGLRILSFRLVPSTECANVPGAAGKGGFGSYGKQILDACCQVGP